MAHGLAALLVHDEFPANVVVRSRIHGYEKINRAAGCVIQRSTQQDHRFQNWNGGAHTAGYPNSHPRCTSYVNLTSSYLPSGRSTTGNLHADHRVLGCQYNPPLAAVVGRVSTPKAVRTEHLVG